jgi:hypothetical protein
MVSLMLSAAVLLALAPQQAERGYIPAVQLPEGFVRFARVPAGGIQPRAKVTDSGLVVLYFKGGDTQGDLFLARSKDEGKTFEASLQVNSTGPALTQEVGHSGSMDVGRDGLAHLLWVAGGDAPKLQYAREKAGGGLEPVQDLGAPARLGRSTAIATDTKGQVFVFYAAVDAVPEDVEAPGLRIWMRRSADGTTFDEPVAIDPKVDGVRDNCAMSAQVDSVRGTICVLYMTVGRKAAPEVRLLSSGDGGQRFVSRVIESGLRRATDHGFMPRLSQEAPSERSPWPPLIASWDTYGRVFWSAIDPDTNKLPDVPIEPKFEQVRRSRAVGLANGSEFLLTWLEHPLGDRTAPPALNWQVWFREGHVPVGRGVAPESPGASIPAVVAGSKGGFTILY